jgi:ribonucleoside-diphosphate reductase alpha chain
MWRCLGRGDGLPPAFVASHEIGAEDHLLMQAALQPYVDSAISKTINVPADCSFDGFVRLYERAYELNLKGCTVFRPNPVTDAVLAEEGPASCQRCGDEREAD